MDKSNPVKKNVNIDYPDVVHDHKQEILTHAHSNSKSPKQIEKIIEESKQNQLQELENEDEEDQKVKLKHLNFSDNQNQVNIGIQGTKTDSSPKNNKSIGSGELKEIDEEDEVTNQKKKLSGVNIRRLSQEQQKLTESLSSIDKEFQNLDQDEKKIFRRQKSFDTQPPQIIDENEDELLENDRQDKKHKSDKFGQTLKKLDKQCQPPKDEEQILRKKSISDMPINLQTNSEPILEKQGIEEEED